MFISQLKNKIAAYDPYGLNQTNGLKALFVLYLMILFYFFSSIPNPYFYFFYLPVTCFAAELLGNTLEEKYLYLTIALFGSILTVFLFGVFSIYKTFFVFFAFFYSLTLYFVGLFKQRNLLTIVPVILSLGSYSLIYGDKADSNFYVAINHALHSSSAAIVMLAGLSLFPKSYYLRIWHKAFQEVMTQLEKISAEIARGETKTIAIFSGIIMMQRYSKMLPKGVKYYSVLKITLLTFELILSMSYLLTFQKRLRKAHMAPLHHYIVLLRDACINKNPVDIHEHNAHFFKETRELTLIHQLILSWNYLCQNK